MGDQLSVVEQIVAGLHDQARDDCTGEVPETHVCLVAIALILSLREQLARAEAEIRRLRIEAGGVTPEAGGEMVSIFEPPARSTLSPEPLISQDRGNIDRGEG